MHTHSLRSTPQNKFFFLKKQIFFAIMAFFILIFISFLEYNQIKALAIVGIIISVILLVLVLIFGSKAKGSTRWLSIMGTSIQPSEFAKIFFIIFNSFCLYKFYEYDWKIKYGFSIFTLLVLIILLFMQPDFGMIVSFIAIWSAQLFLYGLPWILIIIIGITAIFGGIGAYLTLAHVEDRINRFLDSGQKNYQAERAIDAFVNGSFFGKGPGNGMVKKLRHCGRENIEVSSSESCFSFCPDCLCWSSGLRAASLRLRRSGSAGDCSPLYGQPRHDSYPRSCCAYEEGE
jgi:cell division protein FtsW